MKNFNYPQHIFDQPYNFSNNSDSDIRSLIQSINLLGVDLVGLELGVFEANSFMTILHNCPNIKTLYGIDSYRPYCDFLREPYDGNIAYTIDYKKIDLIKSIAKNRMQYSGMNKKIIFYEMDSDDAIKKFEPESLDFIFIDAYMTYEQAKNDIESWYPIVKKGGLFSGHDWNSTAIQKAILDYRRENNIDNIMSTYDNSFCWIK
jgi:hypothetical protein